MKTPITKRLLSMLGGLLVGLLLLEVALRGLGAVVAAGDAERTAAGDLGDWRVLCLGACYTIGLGTAPEESYPALLQDRLHQAHPDASLSVINGGIRGKSTDYFADRIDGLLEVFAPQVVVVNINDRMAYDEADLQRALTRQHAPVRAALSDLRLVRLIQLARTGPPQTIAMDSESWWQDLTSDPQGESLDSYARQIAQLEQAARERPQDPSLQSKLAEVYIERSDHAAALAVLERTTPRKRAFPHHIAMFKCSAALGRFEEAETHLSRAARPQAIAQFSNVLSQPPAPEEGEDVANRYRLRRSYLALLKNDNDAARAELEALLSRDPDYASAYPALSFVRWRQGEDTAQDAVAAFAARPDRAVRTQNGFGLVAEDSDVLISEDEAAQRFEALLDLHLTTIREAAEAEGVVVVLENLSTLPFQQPIITDLAAQHGLPLVDLQGELIRHPDRDRLLHPTQHLRLSAEGNAWVAEQIFAAVQQEGAAPQ